MLCVKQAGQSAPYSSFDLPIALKYEISITTSVFVVYGQDSLFGFVFLAYIVLRFYLGPFDTTTARRKTKVPKNTLSELFYALVFLTYCGA